MSVRNRRRRQQRRESNKFLRCTPTMRLGRLGGFAVIDTSSKEIKR